ncbi:MAG: hypothetical protein ACKVOQ_09445 [Cyclobacteriaceae bacterium]
MLLENRKMQVIEEVIKVNEKTLVELETVLKKNKTKVAKKSILDFVGVISKKEAKQMREVIDETCETIHLDEWK